MAGSRSLGAPQFHPLTIQENKLMKGQYLYDPMNEEEIFKAAGIGNWRWFIGAGLTLEDVYASAADWADAIRGAQRPWLCWNVYPDWCFVQQRLVKMVGCTPVVGFD